MKLCVVGTHGTGKTTLTYQIASEFKKRGRNATVINEVARRCPFPINDGFDTEGAEWIITSQINRELQAKADGYDDIICDRSAYDPICYLKCVEKPIKYWQKLAAYAEEWLKTYDKIIFVIPSGKELVNDGIRSMDIDFQQNVHEQFSCFFKGQTYMKIIPKDRIHQVQSSEIFKNYFEDIYKCIFQ